MTRSNKNKYKELINSGFVYGLTSSLQSVLGFILLPLLTKYITTETFGAYSLILLINTIASSIFYLGASSALGRYYYDNDSFDYRSNIVSISIIITIFGALMLVTLSAMFANSISNALFDSKKYSLPIILSMIGTSFTFLTTLMSLILRYEKKALTFLFVTISCTLINFAITFILLTKFNFEILSPILGILISNGLIFLILLLLNRKFLIVKINKKYLYPMFIFGIQSSVTGLLYYVLDWIDRIILKHFLTLSDVGIYSLGYRLATVINILLILPFSLIWAPMRMENSKNENSNFFVTKIISYYTIIGISFILFSFLFGDIVLKKIFSNSSYDLSIQVFPIIMFSLFIFGYQNILDYGIYLHKKIYLYIYISIIGILLNVILNFAIIPIYGIFGAAISTLITYFLIIFIIYKISNKLYKIQVEKFRVIYPILFTITCYLITIIYNSLIIRISCLGLGAFLFYTLWLQNHEKIFLINKIKFLKNKTIK